MLTAPNLSVDKDKFVAAWDGLVKSTLDDLKKSGYGILSVY